MSTVMLRNVNALGYTDCPEIGRTGPSPAFGDCGTCTEDPTSDHEHELLDPTVLEPGSGCLVPGEEFEVSADTAESLLLLVGTFERVDTDGLDALAVPELKQHAITNGIDLAGATSKKAILAAIRKG